MLFVIFVTYNFYILSYLYTKEKAATTEAIVIEDNLKELSWNRDAEIIGSGTFGLVLCIFAILVSTHKNMFHSLAVVAF